ncbi:hypothetical protein BCU71_09805 [Vibrio lentus]|uniref:phage tail-collar fiber domain-containing protein n=1 Tax=Vibrio lentus TaxID=136468 RepID=UPI000C85BDBA|nr:phage tail protein [Vibrio lentus]PMH24229.1 hypothetical protein BCU71_09805 [Vibrio lentus]
MANTDTDLRCYLTNAGIATENNAIQLGRKLPIKEMVFGSGVLADGEDPRNQTTMISEQFKVPCAMITHSDNTTLLTFKGDIPVDVGGFNINEVAIRLEDGTIYGYARGTGDYKPTPEQGATESIRYVVDMYSTNVSVIECKVDLSNVYVDFEDLETFKTESEQALNEHKEASDPHSQYCQVKDLVGMVVPFHTAGEKRGWLDAKGGELSRVVDKTLWDYAQSTGLVVAQSLKDSEPMKYAMYFGDGDGSNTFMVPNHHLGHFFRGNPSGVAHGETQGDAIRNITGSVNLRDDTLPNSIRGIGGHSGSFTSTHGVDSMHGISSKTIGSGSHPSMKSDLVLDVSLQVPTAQENRPYAANLSIKIHRGWM